MRLSEKQAHFLAIIATNPGITTAELHRRVGYRYAHGHHKFTYDTVSRMIKRGLVHTCKPVDGLRGAGLQTLHR